MEVVLEVELHTHSSVPALMRAMRQAKMGGPVSYEGNVLVGYEGAQPCMLWQFRRPLGPCTVTQIMDDLSPHIEPWRSNTSIQIVDPDTGFHVPIQ